MNKTPQQLAQQLEKLISDSTTSLTGKVINKTGSSVMVKLDSQYRGSQYLSVVAGSGVTSLQDVICLKLDTGEWVAIPSTSTQVTKKLTTTVSKRKREDTVIIIPTIATISDSRVLETGDLTKSTLIALARNDLKRKKYGVKKISTIDLVTLQKFKVFYAPILDQSQVYTSSEAEAIYNFVQGGGSLFVIGEFGLSFSNTVNSLTGIFGVSIQNTLESYTWFVSTTATSHPIISGSNGVVSSVQTAIESAWSLGEYTTILVDNQTPSQPTAIALEVGLGRAVFVGDSNWIDDIRYSNPAFQNKAFWLNIFDWLHRKS